MDAAVAATVEAAVCDVLVLLLDVAVLDAVEPPLPATEELTLLEPPAPLVAVAPPAPTVVSPTGSPNRNSPLAPQAAMAKVPKVRAVKRTKFMGAL